MRRWLCASAWLLASAPPVAGDRVYDADRMYGARAAFSATSERFLRGFTPVVLALDAPPQLLELPRERLKFDGPPSLGPPAKAHEMGMFNPSLARAPKGLCPRCAYLVSIRLDPLHQCDASSPLFVRQPYGKAIATGAWFKGTAIGVADSSLNLLAWTWFLARPEDQESNGVVSVRLRVHTALL